MEKFFDALYTRLILRDVLGKITPGALLLIAVYMSILSPAPDIHAAIAAARATSPSGWLLIFPLGWLTALAIQALGGWFPKCSFGSLATRAIQALSGWLPKQPFGWLATHATQALSGPRWRFVPVPYIRYCDEPIEDTIEYHRRLVHFWKRASEPQQQLFERFVVIHEATGNASLALVLAIPILLVRFYDDATAWFLFACMLFGAIWLGKMHRDALKLKMAIFMEVLHPPSAEAGPEEPRLITEIK
jgi:hypothetical protein